MDEAIKGLLMYFGGVIAAAFLWEVVRAVLFGIALYVALRKVTRKKR